MQPVLNVEDTRRVEKALTRQGVSVSELMHRAGAALAQEVLNMADANKAVVFVGFGNNGGDGWVCAEELLEAGVDVCVVSPCPVDQLHTDLALVVAKSAVEAGVTFLVAPPKAEIEEQLEAADVLVDALLGTGFHGEPEAPFDIWIDLINASGVPVVSADVPSGLSAQTGHAPGGCVWADVTVTMLALKPGLLSDTGRDACGAIVIAPLASQTERLVLDADPVAWRVETPDYLDVLEPPTSAVDKYSRGHVLVVAGSTRYPGAAVLAARAAARSGAGYVTLAVPASIAPLVQMQLVEVPVVPCPYDELEGTFSADARPVVEKLAARADACVAGPGMRVDAATVNLVSGLLESDVPLVLDADALNCVARLTSNRLDNYPELIRRKAPLVMTPHRRELGRLMGLPDTPPDSLTSALEASRRIVWADGGSDVVIVAKGTATACVGVEAALLPKPGPVALATAGTGDVLSGIIAAQLAKTKATGDQLPLLCAFACEVHATAANLAAERFGSTGVMASDVADASGLATDELSRRAALIDTPFDPDAADTPDTSEAPAASNAFAADKNSAFAGSGATGSAGVAAEARNRQAAHLGARFGAALRREATHE